MFLKALCHLCDVWTEDCEAWKVLHCSLTHLGSLSSWITWQSWNTQFTLSDSNSTSQHIEVSEEIKTWLDVVLLSLLKPSIPFLQQGRWDRTLRWGRNDLWDPRDRPLHEGRPCPAHPSSKHTIHQSRAAMVRWDKVCMRLFCVTDGVIAATLLTRSPLIPMSPLNPGKPSSPWSKTKTSRLWWVRIGLFSSSHWGTC